MVSVIIPSRNAEFLQRTIDDLFAKAKGEIEVIVALDGFWPDPPLIDRKNLIIIHHGEVHNNKGMRFSINAGMAIAKGDHVMKIDEHCIVDEGWDEKLLADCEDNWIVIPRRYRIDWEKWDILHDGRPPVDYMHIDYAFQRPNDNTCGLHGAEWKRPERKDILIDDTPSFQGSCYFMSKKHWDTVIKEMDAEKYGQFTQEAQELGMKTWLSGGRVIVNKKTWYAHYHKGSHGKNYGFSNAQYRIHQADKEKGRLYCRDYWLSTKDFKYDWEWFMSKFPDMPGWGTDWKERLVQDRAKETV